MLTRILCRNVLAAPPRRRIQQACVYQQLCKYELSQRPARGRVIHVVPIPWLKMLKPSLEVSNTRCIPSCERSIQKPRTVRTHPRSRRISQHVFEVYPDKIADHS